jgi:FdhD protein
VGLRPLEGRTGQRRTDLVAVEEPLEIRLATGATEGPLVVTMRTPGHDAELAAGFLFTEGLIQGREDLAGLGPSADAALSARERANSLVARLADGVAPERPPLERRFPATSACGVCGKTSLEALARRGIGSVGPGPQVAPELLFGLPLRLRDAQGVFDATGGLHAAGLFSADGELVALREDVGRHNAVDKLVGWALLSGRLPLAEHILLLSGRAGFEIVQKAVAAGVPILAAVSAPSSLAVATAARYGVTLVGFLREGRGNVYCGAERLGLGDPP